MYTVQCISYLLNNLITGYSYSGPSVLCWARWRSWATRANMFAALRCLAFWPHHHNLRKALLAGSLVSKYVETSSQSRGAGGAQAVAWGRYGRQTVRNLVISCWRRWQNPSLWASPLISPFAFFVFWRTAEVWNIFRALFLLLATFIKWNFFIAAYFIGISAEKFSWKCFAYCSTTLLPSLLPTLSLYKCTYKMFEEIEMLPGNLN